jgi:hypothetical protein
MPNHAFFRLLKNVSAFIQEKTDFEKEKNLFFIFLFLAAPAPAPGRFNRPLAGSTAPPFLFYFFIILFSFVTVIYFILGRLIIVHVIEIGNLI